MKLFIFEYFASGTGLGGAELKKSGFAMLNALLTDFTLFSPMKICTLLDYSFKKDIYQASYLGHVEIHWHREEGKNPYELFSEILSDCDLVLIIAPETDGISAGLTVLAEDLGKRVLGTCAKTLEFAGNKANMIKLWQAQGLPVPKSKIISKPFSVQMGRDIREYFSFPFIVKPVRGTGGEGITFVESGMQWERLPEQSYLVQEFVVGEDLSASCFVLDGQVLPLSINRQIIDKREKFIFQGIRVPFVFPNDQDIWELVCKACTPISGLTGFVGVDLVLEPSGPVLMEINPRITSAYLGLREVVPGNLAQDLFSLCLERRFPDRPLLKGNFTYWVNGKTEGV